MTENEIEQFAIKLLQQQGFEYINRASIAPDSSTPERDSFEKVVLV